MRKALIDVSGNRFVDRAGRQVILRGVNLGGDCKLPYPDGGTHLPTDFSDHRTVSFVGRPFPIAEADIHFARIRRWGFNALRLVVTWEAVEHAGPGQYDEAYLDYVAEIARRAESHGFATIVDFHQDVWSRMSGGDGAPGWVFEKLGLDFTRFDAAGAAHVMQHRYDLASPRARQEDRYPTMSWSRNYRLPANGIMWTAFFAGALVTPGWEIDGLNVQHYLQRHYLGAVGALAARLADIDSVIGFDSLNEPSPGWIGQAMSAPQLAATREAPVPVRAGPCWTPFLALRAARGETVEVPVLGAGPDGSMAIVGAQAMNEAGVSIWLPGVADPFEAAGAWSAAGDAPLVLDENFFREAGGRAIDPDTDLMLPFFHAVAEAVRAVRPDWLLFAEMNPYQFGFGRGFPEGMPARCVNAGHWYDVDILWQKSFSADADARALLGRYLSELGSIHAPDSIVPAAPGLVGEFGIPYDLDEGGAFARWAARERDESIWAQHSLALGLMYEALDLLLLSSTQWNYTATNRNDPRIGDGWNQEDLSIYSIDQKAAGGDGARARNGFSRPYVERAQGRILWMRFDSGAGRFEAEIDADPAITEPTEIFIPEAHYPRAIAVAVTAGATWEFAAGERRLRVAAARAGLLRITVEQGAESADEKGDERLDMGLDRGGIGRIDLPDALNLGGQRIE
jgi:hypothetical protein